MIIIIDMIILTKYAQTQPNAHLYTCIAIDTNTQTYTNTLTQFRNEIIKYKIIIKEENNSNATTLFSI